MTHPLRMRIEESEPRDRVHLVVRLALLLAIGTVGCSSVYWLLYLAAPAVAALLISQKGGARYLGEDAPGVTRALRWLAGAYAYLWLLTDRFPTGPQESAVELELDAGGAPTTRSALMRLLFSLPALLLLAILSLAATLLWIAGALAILARGRLPHAIGRFLELVLRFQFRLAAYHLSLVDVYPSFAEAPPSEAHSGAA